MAGFRVSFHYWSFNVEGKNPVERKPGEIFDDGIIVPLRKDSTQEKG
jgi:hypothetical protein